jgi:hypothetical protein
LYYWFFSHYRLPSGCISNLNVPNFQLWLVVVLDILRDIARARALVSIFFVLDVTSKGPNGDPDSESLGKSRKFKVTLVAPV